VFVSEAFGVGVEYVDAEEHHYDAPYHCVAAGWCDDFAVFCLCDCGVGVDLCGCGAYVYVDALHDDECSEDYYEEGGE